VTASQVVIPVIDDSTYHGLDVSGGSPGAAGSLIRVRSGTAVQWANAAPTLGSGEKGRESDTGREKTGDGVTAWAALPYDDVLASESAAGIAVALGG
jgi:hypothetical protein